MNKKRDFQRKTTQYLTMNNSNETSQYKSTDS